MTIQVSNVSKSFGPNRVLDGVTFALAPGKRAGIIGANGAGKSTLLRIIAGQIPPDSGSVQVLPSGSVAYLPQYPADDLDLPMREVLLRGAGDVGNHLRRLTELEALLPSAHGEVLEERLREYALARDEFERLGGYSLEARIDAVVLGLGLSASDFHAPVRTLSGGNKTKLSLARLLLSEASVLLLDEPTNFLDLPALLWLESYVSASDRTFLIVSHDRRFLDRTIDTVLEIDGVEHTVRQWAGTYSDYAEARLREQQKALAAYRDQQAEVARIEEDIRRTKEQARSVEARTKSGLGADHQRRLAKKVAHKAKARERRLERNLHEHALEKPRSSWELHLTDLATPGMNDDRMVLDVRGLRAGYGNRTILDGVDLTVRGQDRVAVVGENGSGKSTLLRCLEGTMEYDGEIKFGRSIRAGYVSQEGLELPGQSPILEVFRARTTMREDEARTYLHKFLFAGDEVFKHIDTLSYGQRSKLALAILILSGANFLVLDEPTSHMDMSALAAIERALAGYAGPILVVSHDRYFLERIGINRIEVLADGLLHAVDTLDAYEGTLA